MATTTSQALATVTFTHTQTLTGSGVVYFSTAIQAAATTKAASQTILSPPHADPTDVNPSDPLVLFVIQVFIIVGFSRLLGLALGKIRQPRVISEVLGGIILGPTAFGRIPGFTSHIFPSASIPYLTLISDIGLIFFLFLVGLEVDFAFFRKNLRVALSVAGAGMIIPFSLGIAVSKGLYGEFITNVGVIVLASGVLNDVTGWILLALSVSLANASSGIVVLYIILCAVGWTLVLWFIVRPAFAYVARRSGSFEGRGPTQSIVCLSLIIVLVSAWVTDQIGVNAIFGGFLAGLVLPREKGFASHLTEKIEDIVTTLFVPIYFATSGLKTNLGLLDNGITWAWTVCIITVAFCGKFFGCAIAAKACGFTFRESGAVGSLMSCKGLIELIVLNIGLNANIITPRVFSMYVLEALLLTFASTPLAMAFYPQRLRRLDASVVSNDPTSKRTGDGLRRRVLVVLERIENLSPVMVFTKLLAPPLVHIPRKGPASATASSSVSFAEKPLETPASPALIEGGPTVDAVRLVELTARTSAVMQASEADDRLRIDPVNVIYSTFTSLNAISINSSTLEIIPQDGYAQKVAYLATEKDSDLILIPWRLTMTGEDSTAASKLSNPLESLFDRTGGGRYSSPQYASFVRDLFADASTDVGLFIERGSTLPVETTTTHLFLAFHGGADDRAALELVHQLVRSNATISATVIRMVRSEASTAEDEVLGLNKTDSDGSTMEPSAQLTIGSGSRANDTVYAAGDHLASVTADDVAWEDANSAFITDRLPIAVEMCRTAHPLQRAVARGREAEAAHSGSRVICIVGRGRRDAGSHRKEVSDMLRGMASAELGICRSSEVRGCVGDAGTAVLVNGVGRFLLVMQSKTTSGVRERA